MKSSILKITIYWIIFIALILSLMLSYLFLSNSNFFSDRLFVLYKDDNNNSNVLMIKLTKYNIFPHFYHYEYIVSLTGKNTKTILKEYEYNSIKNNFKATDFIKNIINTNNENILNEDYAMSLNINNKKIDIDLRDMTGDFLINNTLERLTYVNMGSSTIMIDGIKYKADFVLNKTASVSYRQLILDQSVDARGTAVFFSDMSGGLYYVDISHVFEEGSKYMSHAWALNKNEQILKKDVGEKVVLVSNNKGSVVFNLPAFNNARVKLDKVADFSFRKTSYNLLEGELVDDNGEKIIAGFNLNYDDSK